MEFRAPDRSMVAALLGLKEYPRPTVPGLFNELLRAPYEFVLTQSYVCLDKATARSGLKRQRDRLESTEDDGLEEIEELEVALNDLQSNRFTIGEHHLVLLVKADDVKSLGNNVAEARAALGDSGCVVAREDLAMEAAFWSQLPGNFKLRPRPSPITSYNFVGMSAYHNYPTGKRTGNHWGDAVALLKTTSGAPYFFNYHRRDLGITLLTGQSGTGKTATQNFLAAQAEKFDPTAIYFDKDRGSEIFVLANGGLYFPLTTGTPTGFAPFALPATPGWIETARRLVMTCARRQDRPFSAREEREIADAIDGVFALPAHLRRFGQLLSFLEPPDENNLAARLMKWCTSEHGVGALSWVFDNPIDLLDVGAARMFGFDYTEFLDNPEVRTPLMMYLWARFSTLIDGRRLYMFIDEFWKALEDEYFEAELQNRYKTIRKQNWFLVCATQSPGRCDPQPHRAHRHRADGDLHLPAEPAGARERLHRRLQRHASGVPDDQEPAGDLPPLSRQARPERRRLRARPARLRRRARRVVRHDRKHPPRRRRPPPRRHRPGGLAPRVPPGKESSMKLIQRLVTGVALATGIGSAHAGIPVIDVANLAQSIQQVVAWAQQNAQMVQQITELRNQYTQLTTTYNSLTGNRGLGTLLNGVVDQAARRYLPGDGTQISQLGSGVAGYGGLQATINRYRSIVTSMPGATYLSGSEELRVFTARINSMATQQALGEAAFTATSQRTSDLENMIATIGVTGDAKAIGEINARIAAQQALIANEATRLQALSYMQQLEQQKNEQAGREMVSKWGTATLPAISF